MEYSSSSLLGGGRGLYKFHVISYSLMVLVGIFDTPPIDTDTDTDDDDVDMVLHAAMICSVKVVRICNIIWLLFG